MVRLRSIAQTASPRRSPRCETSRIFILDPLDPLDGCLDVVPVLPATKKLWTHVPYGGEYDEETGLIWGRGSSDDKSGVIGALYVFVSL